MTIPDFKKVEDLTDFLANQENRIYELEQANAALIAEVKKRFIARNELPDVIAESVPRTGLLSRFFLKRSFTVWGHFFVAQLLINIVIAILYLIVFVLILNKSILPWFL